jgi:hypothetical protein
VSGFHEVTFTESIFNLSNTLMRCAVFPSANTLSQAVHVQKFSK